MAVPEFVHDDLKRLDIDLAEDRIKELARYLDLLLDTNQRVNLTGIKDRDEAWRRLIIDSLTVLPGLSPYEDARVADVGSGGGLPGIPLAICRPDLAFVLIESTGKKAKFLESVGLPNVQVINDRAEHIGQNPAHRQHYDVAVCRAIGPMRETLEYTLPLVRVGGCLLAMKGPSVEDELNDAADALMTLGAGEMQVIDAYPEEFGINTLIVRVEKSEPTPSEYPRLPGIPRQSPL